MSFSQTHSQSTDKRSTPTKRPRPVISCLTCRQKKLKCDRLLPCQQCIRGARAQACRYAPGQEPVLRENALSGVQSPQTNQRAHDRESSLHQQESRQVDGLIERLRDVERALHLRHSAVQNGFENGESTRGSDDAAMDVDDATLGVADTLAEGYDGKLSLIDFPVADAFVQSSSAPRDGVELHAVASDLHELNTTLQKVSFSRVVLYSNNEEVLEHMIRLLPDIRTCKTLVHLYFENFEHCARILHRPSFLEASHAFFMNETSKEDRNLFVPALLAVLAIASLLNTLPECNVPQLHGKYDGVGATVLLDCWIRNLPSIEQRKVPGLQVQLLSMLIRRIRSDPIDSLWATSGQIVRLAMLAHLHKPAPKSASLLESEMRCRLWLTILEQDLALSIMCAMPSHALRYNLAAPLNINDEELLQPDSTEVTALPRDHWTDGLCQSFLAESFNARLQAYNTHHETDKKVSYAQVLQHAIHLEQILRDLPSPFRLDQNNSPGRLMAQMEVDVTLRRPLIALYAPFAKLMQPDDCYREARMAWVQSNLVILCYQDLFDPKYPGIDVPRPEGYWDFYYAVYSYDVFYGLMAEILEFQRMKTSNPDADGLEVPRLQRHAAQFQTPTLGWNIEGMTKSIEETIEPLVRRVGSEGPGLREVVLATLVFGSLAVDHSNESEESIMRALKQLVATIRLRLQRDAARSQAMQYPWLANTSQQSPREPALQWFPRYIKGNGE